MKWKKIVSVMLVGVMAGTLLFGCGGESESAENTTNDGFDKMKVSLLCVGNLGDKGFNDSAAKGLEKMNAEFGAETKLIELGRDESTYEGNFYDVSESGYDLIISGTWSAKEVIEKISAEYPENKYLCFDSEVDRSIATEGNIMGITYEGNQAAYLCGVLSAKMFETGNEKIDPSQKKLGFIGSMDTAVINDFLIGYIEGVKSVDPEIKIMTSYVGSYEDVSKCMEMTTQLYNQGAQIVYAPTSQSILGSVSAAQKADKYLITCDQDMYTELKDSEPELAPYILSSSLKNIGASLVAAVEGWKDGSMSFEEDYVLGLESGSVGLAKNENYESIVPEDVKALIDETEQKIINGDIKVSTAFGMTTEEIAALRDEMKP